MQDTAAPLAGLLPAVENPSGEPKIRDTVKEFLSANA
jgi:hypothetical protein